MKNLRDYLRKHYMVIRLRRKTARHGRRHFKPWYKLAAGATQNSKRKDRTRLPGGQKRPINRPELNPDPFAKLLAEGAKTASKEPPKLGKWYLYPELSQL